MLFQPKASLVVRVGLIIVGATASLFSLFLAALLGFIVGTGPEFTGHKHFLFLINREGDWLLACAVLVPIVVAFPKRQNTLSCGIGYIAIGLGVALYSYWKLAEPHLDAPAGYEGNVLGLGEIMSVCLLLAGIFRVCLAHKLARKRSEARLYDVTESK